jgi:glycosyltransferase involved in cell wall biosynthesis
MSRSRPKIALVNVFFPPQSIGGATRVLADNVAVLTAKYEDCFDLVAFTTESACRDPHQLDAYAYEGFRVYRSTALWRENMDWYSHDGRMGELFAKFLDFEKPDLVHFHCIQRITGAAVEATRARRIPYLITAHDAWWISDFQFLVDELGTVYPEGHPDPFVDAALPTNVTREQSIKRRCYLRGLLAGADRVLTVSEKFRDLYIRNGAGKVITNKNGISDNVPWRSKSTAENDRVVCGHIGGMSEHKGYQLLQKAIERARPKSIEMLIVDHGASPNSRRHASWGGVPVTFVSPYPQEKIADLYGQIDVLFAPSIWPESFGLVTREASACNCWVVASDIGAIGEDVNEDVDGHIVAANHLQDLVDVINRIDRSPTKYKMPAPAKNIRLASLQVEQLVEIYREVTHGEKGAFTQRARTTPFNVERKLEMGALRQ